MAGGSAWRQFFTEGGEKVGEAERAVDLKNPLHVGDCMIARFLDGSQQPVPGQIYTGKVEAAPKQNARKRAAPACSARVSKKPAAPVAEEIPEEEDEGEEEEEEEDEEEEEEKMEEKGGDEEDDDDQLGQSHIKPGCIASLVGIKNPDFAKAKTQLH